MVAMPALRMRAKSPRLATGMFLSSFGSYDAKNLNLGRNYIKLLCDLFYDPAHEFAGGGTNF
jgi:hypothetical protein